jgi:hypothetical protein
MTPSTSHPVQDRRVAFVLAGYRGSGKTTLLEAAIKRRQPLFGPTFDAEFQTVRLPSRFPESALAYAECRAERCWLTLNHLPHFFADPEPPRVVAIHLDLAGLLTIFRLEGDPTAKVFAPESELLRRPIEIARIRELTAEAADMLGANLAKRYDAVVVNTVQTPWDVIMDRVDERAYAPGSLSHFLFNRDDPRDDIHAAVHQAWSSEVHRLRPAETFATRSRADGVEIDRVA